VGQSEPASDWASFQPVGAEAARTIRFSLGTERAPACRLRLALLIERPSVPGVRIGINGHDGLFLLHPDLDYNMGDQAGGGTPDTRTPI